MYRNISEIWPPRFERVPAEEPWVTSPIDASAHAYDAVKQHTWYHNLRPTLQALADVANDGDIVIDYSAGTGIFTEEFLRRFPEREIGLMLVDASPKFLRLALEKFRDDDRTAYRRLQYLKNERRLQQLEEVLPESLCARGVDGLCSTNAVHLYGDLAGALASWSRVLRTGGFVLIQSGNIDNPDAENGSWFIDHTVEHLQPCARELVKSDKKYAPFRNGLEDNERTESYDRLRQSYFLPIRPLGFYVDSLRDAGFAVDSVETQSVDALVAEWADFLCAYHEGVLGWAGGCSRVEERDPGDDLIALRKQLLCESMIKLFEDEPSFRACWTHIRCTKS